MDIKILDSILHGALKPWKIDTVNSKRIIALVKASKAVKPISFAELNRQLKELLTDYPVLVNELRLEHNDHADIVPMPFKVEFPKCPNPLSNFYQLIITNETLRLFNYFIRQAENWPDLVDIRFQVGRTLTSIRVLAKQTVIELQEQGFTYNSDLNENITFFALYNLKHCLIQLYFSIQEYFKESLETIISLEDFYLLDLEEVNPEMISLTPQDKILNKDTDEWLNFGFKEDKETLKNTLRSLQYRIDLLNEDKCSVDDLFEVLISKRLKPGSKKKYLGCETTIFRDIIDHLKIRFNNLKFTTIESSKVFYSKLGNPITSQNLYSSKIENSKSKEDIDSIFKQWK